MGSTGRISRPIGITIPAELLCCVVVDVANGSVVAAGPSCFPVSAKDDAPGEPGPCGSTRSWIPGLSLFASFSRATPSSFTLPFLRPMDVDDVLAEAAVWVLVEAGLDNVCVMGSVNGLRPGSTSPSPQTVNAPSIAKRNTALIRKTRCDYSGLGWNVARQLVWRADVRLLVAGINAFAGAELPA